MEDLDQSEDKHLTSVFHLLRKLKTDKAMGSDRIPPLLLKMSAQYISEPLSHIYNLSFRTGLLPNAWKLADIVPIPKTVPVQKNKLRPISLLPVISKVCEKIVLTNFYDFLANLYDDFQYAYRKNSSTVCALLAIHDAILCFLDDPDICAVRVITFDMSHAFDSVSHSMLLEKFLENSSPDSMFFIRWLRDYLTNRRQRVKTWRSDKCIL